MTRSASLWRWPSSREIAVVVGLVGVGVIVEQEARHLRIAVQDRMHQDRLAVGISGIHLRPFVQQGACDVRGIFVQRQHQQRHAFLIFCVRVSSLRKQFAHCRRLIPLNRLHDRTIIGREIFPRQLRTGRRPTA